jgi:hypothetical protein
MLEAAKALTREKNLNLGDDPAEVTSEFKKLLVDTQLFRDHANYFLRAKERESASFGLEQARQRVQEAQLFIDSAHTCVERMDAAAAAAVAAAQAASPAPAE